MVGGCYISKLTRLLQKHELSGETELRRGLWGGHQPPGQHGAVRVLRLPIHGKSLETLIVFYTDLCLFSLQMIFAFL